MNFIDVFNGDADGICALHQLRLANPVESQLVTGVKRDIDLLKRVNATQDDMITILDISLDKNRESLIHCLNLGAHVIYFDHHFAGEIPQYENLEIHINTDANTCSSLLVNEYLNNKYLAWAVTAAFGDNLFISAAEAAIPLNLSATQLEELKQLGTCINYNGYGATLDDLIFTPSDLYKLIHPYEDPFEFIHNEKGYQTLQEGYQNDIASAEAIKPEYSDQKHALYIMPNDKWTRRVSGVYANKLAQDNPERAHAIFTENNNGSYLVSVRAPLINKTGADELCRQFETGGGRKAAAGINELPFDKSDVFLKAFINAFKV